MKHITFIDTEVSETTHKVCDFGAITENDDKLHTESVHRFLSFIENSVFICGHNIIEHDLKYTEIPNTKTAIDTLFLSPLLFPNRPYHALVKDDKLQTEELNNPLNDSIKARTLFYDEMNAFEKLDDSMKRIFYGLLREDIHFSGFFDYVDYESDIVSDKLVNLIAQTFDGKICENASIYDIIVNTPIELAYCLAQISATEDNSIIPRWVRMNYPRVNNVLRLLRNTSCHMCSYCHSQLDPVKYLEKYFGYPSFRTYDGEPLQENAVNAAVEHKSLLAIFPTGGGKSLTFQIPAFMAGDTERALTVVISPLQSLMKDQVDNLEKRGLTHAVTINGLLSPIERAEAIERVESGLATILYISPELLRSSTIERLLLSRRIDRFVIDEAHCFSAWGQDFRVDYLYIADFINELQDKKGYECRIPVSCFTATAKQKVISDIKDYFKKKLNIELDLFATNATRKNLRYEVLYQETSEEKYRTLRNLIEAKKCSTIVYVSRTKRTKELADRLNNDGISARPFNGKMDSIEKQNNQEAFINDEIQVIVATSAFGMGVDKANVKLVIHYDISDSLENYVQEAGRAGRDQSLEAECYVLFNDGDLDKHFLLLNQTKLSFSEIQQVWKAVKNITNSRSEICCSPLEIAREAGWDEEVQDVETRVKTALQALENAGYIRRGKNAPRVYATSLLVKNMVDARKIIDNSLMIQSDSDKENAIRIVQSLISKKSTSGAGNSDAESRVDYLADRLGIEKSDIIKAVQQLREARILADTNDLTAYFDKSDTAEKSLKLLQSFQKIETFLMTYIESDKITLCYKQIMESINDSGIKINSDKKIRTLLYFWTISGFIEKDDNRSKDNVTIVPKISIQKLKEKRENSYQISTFIIRYLFEKLSLTENLDDDTSGNMVWFSVMDITEQYRTNSFFDASSSEVENALLFLSKIGALKLEGGFFVLYNGLRIKRLLDRKLKYKKEDYRLLDEFYKQKIQQIHIVGEYANMMVSDYNKALQFVSDYFQMDYKKFLKKYFSEERTAEIERNISPKKYEQLIKSLSSRQLEIIHDEKSKYIVVAAGPGSGKTKVLVHKLASLLMLEDVKHEQLLMLTFSRSAAIEFKMRLQELIGNAAYFVEIKTFHSYCFDLIGRIGNLQNSQHVIKDACEMLKSGEIETSKITKSVLVIDEAQDMDSDEFELVTLLMKYNEDMRIIAVGDDDQNIYQFRGSDSKYLKSFITDYEAKQYSLVNNYRSYNNVVSFANRFVKTIPERMKTEEIYSVKGLGGEVKLISHSCENMEIPVVADIDSLKAGETCCVMTKDNNEALLLLGLLKQRNIPANLIQSIDGFDLFDIAEIRFFLKKLNTDNDNNPVISDESWESAICLLKSQYCRSTCLKLIIRILQTFRDLNQQIYRTDLMVFLHESKIEDFFLDEKGTITISTIHKSKGREFDNVYMLLKNIRLDSDEELRKLYVGMTRAKNKLHIHYQGTIFDRFAGPETIIETDNIIYPKPSELILQLSHKDVYLDFFKDKKKFILQLRSGDRLEINEDRLYAEFKNLKLAVLKFSKKCFENVLRLKNSGYEPYYAEVRFICAWKRKDESEETAIVLADLHFVRSDV